MIDQDVPREHRVNGDLVRPGRLGEPRGTRPDRSLFVIQKPDSAGRHLDFRLEIGGVLVSWAIPTSPSLDPGDKRLAIRERDHPLDHAGDTLVWDSGTFDNLCDRPVEDGLAEGRLRLWLEGDRLRGRFAMARTRLSGTQEQWLLIKKDDGADPDHEPVPPPRESVTTGRTTDDRA